jgi:hypothetical protein
MARGRDAAEAEKIIADAKALDDAGAFSIVVEGVVEPIAIAMTEAVSCPVIGIGGSARCDGQVLVTEDMVGMFERVPRFVKRYADVASVICRRRLCGRGARPQLSRHRADLSAEVTGTVLSQRRTTGALLFTLLCLIGGAAYGWQAAASRA